MKEYVRKGTFELKLQTEKWTAMESSGRVCQGKKRATTNVAPLGGAFSVRKAQLEGSWSQGCHMWSNQKQETVCGTCDVALYSGDTHSYPRSP